MGSCLFFRNNANFKKKGGFLNEIITESTIEKSGQGSITYFKERSGFGMSLFLLPASNAERSKRIRKKKVVSAGWL